MVGEGELKTMLLALWNMLDSVEGMTDTVDEMVRMVFASQETDGAEKSAGLPLSQFKEVCWCTRLSVISFVSGGAGPATCNPGVQSPFQ